MTSRTVSTKRERTKRHFNTQNRQEAGNTAAIYRFLVQINSRPNDDPRNDPDLPDRPPAQKTRRLAASARPKHPHLTIGPSTQLRNHSAQKSVQGSDALAACGPDRPHVNDSLMLTPVNGVRRTASGRGRSSLIVLHSDGCPERPTRRPERISCDGERLIPRGGMSCVHAPQPFPAFP